MDDISESRAAFAKQLESMIFERRLQLVPLESGDMRFAYRSGAMGSEWVDVTDAHTHKLRTEIAAMQAIADRLREAPQRSQRQASAA